MKLYRPNISTKIRITVAARQCYQAGLNPPMREECESRTSLLARQLAALARAWECEVSDLRLDHDPPLGARPRRGEGNETVYEPAANDPEYLNYRPHGPQFKGSHLIKTNVRGEHGQHPDRVLIKKQRRLEQGPKPKRKAKIASRKQPWPKRKVRSKLRDRP